MKSEEIKATGKLSKVLKTGWEKQTVSRPAFFLQTIFIKNIDNKK